MKALRFSITDPEQVPIIKRVFPSIVQLKHQVPTYPQKYLIAFAIVTGRTERKHLVNAAENVFMDYLPNNKLTFCEKKKN